MAECNRTEYESNIRRIDTYRDVQAGGEKEQDPVSQYGFRPEALRDRIWGHSATSSARAEALQGAQRTHGNRAVQRFLQRGAAPADPVEPMSATSSPVQRQVAGEGFTPIQRFMEGLTDWIPKDHGIGKPFMLPGMGGPGRLPNLDDIPDFSKYGIGKPFMPGNGTLPGLELPFNLDDILADENSKYLMD